MDYRFPKFEPLLQSTSWFSFVFVMFRVCVCVCVCVCQYVSTHANTLCVYRINMRCYWLRRRRDSVCEPNLPINTMFILVLLLSQGQDMWLPPLFHYLSWDQVRWILGPQSSVKWARMYMLDTRWYSQWSAYQNCTTNHLPTPLPSPVMTQTMTRIPIIHLENRTIPTASYSEDELICRSMIHEKKALAL